MNMNRKDQAYFEMYVSPICNVTLHDPFDLKEGDWGKEGRQVLKEEVASTGKGAQI